MRVAAGGAPSVTKVSGAPYYYEARGYLNEFYYNQTNGLRIPQTAPEEVQILRIDTDVRPVFRRLAQEGFEGLGYLAFSSTVVPSEYDLKRFAADKGADLLVMRSFFLKNEAVNQPVVGCTSGTRSTTQSFGSGVGQGTTNFNGQVGGSPLYGSSNGSAYGSFAGTSTTTTTPQYTVQYVPGQAARCLYLVKLLKKTR